MRKIAILLLCVLIGVQALSFSLKDLGSGKKYFNKAEKEFNAGNYQNAIPLYLKFLSKKKNKDNEKALYHISVCYMELGNPASGFPYIHKLYQIKGDKLEYAVLFAEYLVQLNQPKKAIEVYEKIIKLHPEDYLSYIRLGELLVNQGNIKRARELWLKATTLNDKPEEAYALLSESYLKVEKNKLLAYFYARKLLEIVSPEKKGEIQQMLDRIAGDFKEDFENYYLLRTCKEKAREFIKNNDFESAYSSLEKCEDLENIDKEYLLLFANISKKLEKWSKAIELYKKCLALGFESGDIYLELGKCYLKIGKKGLAKANFKLALRFKETKEDALKLLQSI